MAPQSMAICTHSHTHMHTHTHTHTHTRAQEWQDDLDYPIKSENMGKSRRRKKSNKKIQFGWIGKVGVAGRP